MKDSGVRAIESLVERRQEFDFILLETTGLADPGPIASMFWLDKALESKVKLDGVVTVIDAKNIMRNLSESSEGINEATKYNKLNLTGKLLWQIE